jgi:hypothetical protein
MTQIYKTDAPKCPTHSGEEPEHATTDSVYVKAGRRNRHRIAQRTRAAHAEGRTNLGMPRTIKKAAGGKR